MGIHDLRPCPCKSGKDSWWMLDCKGIPLERVCDDCEQEKRGHYNSWVFDGYSQADIDEPIEEDE